MTGPPRVDLARATRWGVSVTKPFHLLEIESAVGILTLQAIVINRLAGADCTLLARRNRPASTEPVAGGS